MSRSESGFTLIEVLVAVVVLGLAAGATASSMRSTTTFLGENSLHAEAVTLAQKAVEDLRTVPYEDIESDSEESEDGTFLITTDVFDDVPDHGMKTIHVIASWTSRGEEKTYELQTIYSRITKD